MKDVAFDVGMRLQRDPLSTDGSDHAAADDNVIGTHIPFDKRLVANDK